MDGLGKKRWPVSQRANGRATACAFDQARISVMPANKAAMPRAVIQMKGRTYMIDSLKRTQLPKEARS
jgi:hypothetical protein